MGAWRSGLDCCYLVFNQRQIENAHITKHLVKLHQNGIQSHSTINVPFSSVQPKTIPAAYLLYLRLIRILCRELNLRFRRVQIMSLSNSTNFASEGKRVIKYVSHCRLKTCLKKGRTSPSSLNHIPAPLLNLIALSKYPLCLSAQHLFYFFFYHFKPTE